MSDFSGLPSRLSPRIETVPAKPKAAPPSPEAPPTTRSSALWTGVPERQRGSPFPGVTPRQPHARIVFAPTTNARDAQPAATASEDDSPTPFPRPAGPPRPSEMAHHLQLLKPRCAPQPHRHARTTSSTSTPTNPRPTTPPRRRPAMNGRSADIPLLFVGSGASPTFQPVTSDAGPATIIVSPDLAHLCRTTYLCLTGPLPSRGGTPGRAPPARRRRRSRGTAGSPAASTRAAPPPPPPAAAPERSAPPA